MSVGRILLLSLRNDRNFNRTIWSIYGRRTLVNAKFYAKFYRWTPTENSDSVWSTGETTSHQSTLGQNRGPVALTSILLCFDLLNMGCCWHPAQLRWCLCSGLCSGFWCASAVGEPSVERSGTEIPPPHAEIHLRSSRHHFICFDLLDIDVFLMANLARLGSSISPWDTKSAGGQGASFRFFTDNPNGCLGK